MVPAYVTYLLHLFVWIQFYNTLLLRTYRCILNINNKQFILIER